MKKTIDLDAILAPFPGDNPAGQDLRYSPVYEEIKEARRADDQLDYGDWQREIKTSDWDKALALALEALTQKTKDLQIAAWLAEALLKTEGLSGFAAGLKIVNGLLNDFWEHVYPEIEDGDLDFRVGPIEFLNDKLWLSLKEVPLTDGGATSAYNWIQWQESRRVGYEKDTRNRYGDVDDKKKAVRDELIAEGKLAAEDFDAAVGGSSRAFYEKLSQSLAECRHEFDMLDEVSTAKFGSNAPRLSELRKAFEDLEQFVSLTLKEKRKLEPDAEPPPQSAEEAPAQEGAERLDTLTQPTPSLQAGRSNAPSSAPVSAFVPLSVTDSPSLESALWKQALQALNSSGIRIALGQILAASCSAPSVREQNRYRLLMAKLCLEAKRPDLARPIVEQLHAVIEELHLERWESPIWIAEVLDAYYQCLMAGEPSDEDAERAKALFQRLCTTDVTKAIAYRL